MLPSDLRGSRRAGAIFRTRPTASSPPVRAPGVAARRSSLLEFAEQRRRPFCQPRARPPRDRGTANQGGLRGHAETDPIRRHHRNRRNRRDRTAMRTASRRAPAEWPERRAAPFRRPPAPPPRREPRPVFCQGPHCDAQSRQPSRPPVLGQRVETCIGGSVVGNARMRQKRADRGEQHEQIEVRQQAIQQLCAAQLWRA